MKAVPVDPEQLAASHLWICRVTARRLTRRWRGDYAEAYSAALAGLAEVIRNYDGAADGGEADEFASRAHACIRRRVLSTLHAGAPKGYRRRMGLTRPETPKVVPLSALGRHQPATDEEEPPVGWAIEWEEDVLALSRRLPPRHGELLRGRYLHADGESIGDLARRMGLKESRANQLHREAMAMLREQFGAAEKATDTTRRASA